MKMTNQKTAIPVCLSAGMLVAAIASLELGIRSKASAAAPIEVMTTTDEVLEVADAYFQGQYFQNMSSRDALSLVQSGRIQSEQEGEANEPSQTSLKFAQALNLSRSGNSSEAIEIYHEILADKPNHQMASINLAILYKKQAQFETALKWLTHAAVISGSSRKGKIYSLTGDCLVELNRHEEAIAFFEKSIDFRPGHSATWKMLARALAKTHSPLDKVAVTYDRAMALDRENKPLVLEKAKMQADRLDFEGAKKSLLTRDMKQLAKRSLREQRDFQYFRILLDTGRHESARDYAKKLQNSKFSEEVNALSQFYARKTTPKDLARLEMSVEKKAIDQEVARLVALGRGAEIEANESSRALYALSLRSLKTENLARLTELAGAFAARENKNLETAEPANLAFIKARVHQALGEASLAMTHITEALKHRPEHRKFAILLAELELETGQIQQAQTRLAKLSKAYPKSRKVKRAYAAALHASGELDQAIAQYQELVARNPRRTDLKVLANLHLENRHYDAAILTLHEALDIRSNDLEARYALAIAYCDLGQRKECEKQAKLILKLDTSHQGAKQLLAQSSQQDRTLQRPITGSLQSSEQGAVQLKDNDHSDINMRTI